MSKQNKILIGVISAVVVIALIVVGVFVANNNSSKNTTTPFGQTTSTPKATNKASEEPIDPAITPGTTVSPKPNDVNVDPASQLTEAQKLFPDAHATKKHSKDEVQLALYTAYMYASQATSDTYFLSGEFVSDDMPEEKFNNELGSYYSVNGYANVIQEFKDLKSTDADKIKAAQENIISQALYVYAGKGTDFQLPAKCLTGQEKCLKSGIAPKFGDLSYDDDASDPTRIAVKMTLTSDPIYIKNGVTGHIDASYTFNLFMVAATDSNKKTEGFNYSYLIDGFQNNVDRSIWKQG